MTVEEIAYTDSGTTREYTLTLDGDRVGEPLRSDSTLELRAAGKDGRS